MKHSSILLVLVFLTSSCITPSTSYKEYVSQFYSEKSEHKREEEISKYNLNSNETLVDVGTGNTFFACEIARKYPEMKFILEDIRTDHYYGGKYGHPALIVQKNEYCTALRGRSVFVLGNHSKIPIPSNSQTQILIRGTFHELKQTKSILHELERILKIGGIVIIADYEPRYEGETDPGCHNLYIPENTIIKNFKDFHHLSSDSVIHGEHKLYILRFQKYKNYY